MLARIGGDKHLATGWDSCRDERGRGLPGRPAGCPSALWARPAGPISGRDATVVACTLTWVPLVLVLDRGADLWSQRALGLGTWLLLGWLLRRETPLVRAQVAVVIAFATAVEYTFSPLLEVYVYRLDNVPAFVPPGHGLVYLCALAIGRTAVVQRRRTPLVVVTVLAGAAYAGWGLLVSDRLDVLGALWFCCLLGFLRWGRSVTLYVGAFAVVTYLELLGTWLGTWAWAVARPDRADRDRQPPLGGGRRLRLVRPRRGARRTGAPARRTTFPGEPPKNCLTVGQGRRHTPQHVFGSG